MNLTRRAALTAAASAAAIPSVAAATPDAPHGALDRTLTRIAFGSCAKQNKDQPIWDAVLAARPDLFIFLGDNIYADTRDMAVVREKYAQLAAKPGFRKLRASTPVCAIWDDHDFGEDDAGGDYPMKAQTREIFCDFWGEPASSPRRSRDGIYAAYVFGPPGRRVQLIMPDLRWNRDPLLKLDLGGADFKAWAEKKAKAGEETPGPYARNPDTRPSMLGARQWTWLEAQLRQPADLRILCSSLQYVADFAGWEGWINFTGDHQRLPAAIRAAKANRLIVISGDTHYGEISRLDLNTPYPLWDITSSGLTEVWPVTPPNARRTAAPYFGANFGLLTIDWAHAAPRVTAEVRDVTGAAKLTAQIDTASLVVR